MKLIANTREVSVDLDLIEFAGDDGAVWRHEDTGIAGRGEATRVVLPRGLGDPDAPATVRAALDAIEWLHPSDEPGAGPLAIGALPFDRHQRAELVVPEVILRKVGDRAWLTTIASSAVGVSQAQPLTGPAKSHDAREARETAHTFSLTATLDHSTWSDLVVDATKAIATGAFDKVVLAREVVVESNTPVAISDIAHRLARLYPSCMVFAIDGFVGASPELLVARRGLAVRSHPLAGTLPHSGDPRVDEQTARALLDSTKDRWEHKLVVDAVAACLDPLCRVLDVPGAPTILPLRNVIHLGTEIAGVLRNPAPTALELVSALHPTPAVAGTPTDAALAHIAEVEGFDRGRYSGPVGWVDSRGDGEWAIGIRSAAVSGTTARLYAGVGVVEGSEPEAELAETQLKLQALLAAVVRP